MSLGCYGLGLLSMPRLDVAKGVFEFNEDAFLFSIGGSNSNPEWSTSMQLNA